MARGYGDFVCNYYFPRRVLYHFFGNGDGLLLIKALHWLAQKRVEYIKTTPTVSRLSHFRIISFMAFLFALGPGLRFSVYFSIIFVENVLTISGTFRPVK